MVDDRSWNMTTNVVVGRRAADAAAAAGVRRRTVSTDSIRSVVSAYVNYRSSMPSRRNGFRLTDDEDHIDGSMADVDGNAVTTSLPPGVERAVQVLSKEFEQRYERAS